VIQKSMSLKYEPASEPLHIFVKWLSRTLNAMAWGSHSVVFFFFTLGTGPRRSLSLKLSDARVYEPQIRARLAVCRAIARYLSMENEVRAPSSPLENV